MSRPSAATGNRAVEAAQVIEELIQLARSMREANARGETRWVSPKTSSPSTTRSRRTTAPCRCSATRRYATSRASWSTPCGKTSESTGRFAKTSAPTCVGWSSASCASTATRPTSRRRRRGRCSNKRKCCPLAGPYNTGSVGAARIVRCRLDAQPRLIAPTRRHVHSRPHRRVTYNPQQNSRCFAIGQPTPNVLAKGGSFAEIIVKDHV